MSDSFLVELKWALDTLADNADFEDASSDERGTMDAAVRTFKDQGAELLADATPYLWQYYRTVVEEFTADQRAAYGIPELNAGADNIWSEAIFRLPPSVVLGGRPLEPAPCYISFEAEVSWEPEHGLQLVFENGERVCKVGPYDGHNTVAHAYGNASLLGVIFG